ncbi:MAG TPA: FKBP-type peptidyl-prolyl cis-trans isomerase [Bacteroidales bacterium]|nr:FKBP-type peptidyl-prolyl cis-trans isomerase [Bacteroidales bacterium]
MKRLGSFMVFVAAVALTLGSCMKTEDFGAVEQNNIDDFISKHPDIPFTQKASGLYYFEVAPGEGDVAKTHDTVYVFYTGKFLDGSVFDTNVGKQTLGFAVGEAFVIPGFDEAVSYMRQGGKSTFIIPSKLGYGPMGYYTIPGYTPLLYEVTMVKLAKGPAR